MRYVKARYKKYLDDLAYRIYISDTLYYKSQDKALTKRYIDMIKDEHIEDNRSGDEIAEEVMEKCGLKLKGSE